MATVDKMTKSLLNTIHHRRLKQGYSNNVHKEKILHILGGIDQIISDLLKSNVILNDTQLVSLRNTMQHHTPPPLIKKVANIEDRGYTNTVKFTFNDDDLLFFSIFSRKTATNIMNILSHKITKIVLIMIFCIWVIMYFLLAFNLLSPDIYYGYHSSVYGALFVYCFGWILYANTEAMKLLLKEFEFWFKLFYLFIYLIGKALIAQYAQNDPIHFICATTFAFAAFLFLVMILETVNISQTSKIMMSSFVLGLFSFNALWWSECGFYKDECAYYNHANVQIPDFLGLGTGMTFNLIDVTSNSARILSIFLMKQLISSITRPNKASVITRKPVIIFENTKENVLTIKDIKKWKRMAISVWVFVAILSLAVIALQVKKANINAFVLFVIIFLLLTLITICLCMRRNIKFIWAASIGIIVLLLVFVIGSFLLNHHPGGIIPIFFGVGFSGTYTLKVSKFNNQEIQQCKNQQEIQQKNEIKLEMPVIAEIEVQTIHTATRWDDLDERSVQSDKEKSESP